MVSNLRERAEAAWRLREREEALARSRVEAVQLAAAIVDVFGVDAAAARPLPTEYAGLVMVDDLLFALHRAGGIALVGSCAHCGASVASAPIGSLADLGQLLEEFRPDPSHACAIEQRLELARAEVEAQGLGAEQ